MNVKQDIDKLNESLSPLGISPFKKNKIRLKRYSNEKAKKVDEVVRKKLRLLPAKDPEPEPVHPAFEEMLEQLKEKFHQSKKTSEKIQVLTALPKSWGIKRVMKEFQAVGATQHMIRRAKALVQEKGILSTPNRKAGKTLLEETARLVNEFYENDELSRMMPGKKDCVTMKIDGVKQKVQKRLLLCNLIEAYRKFKDEGASKVGFSKFALLRPKNVVLAGASGTHSVCVCTIHQNVKLMVEACRQRDFQELIPDHTGNITYKDLLSLLSCNPATPDCFLDQCQLCKSTVQAGPCEYCSGVEGDHCTCRKFVKFKESLISTFNELAIDEITYKAWVNVDRTTLETITKSPEEFVETLINKLFILRCHDFIAKQQASFLESLKSSIKPGEIIVLGDFAENYSFLCQDAAQGFHWTNEQATLHSTVIYYRTAEGEAIKHACFVVISNHMKHDAISVHVFMKRMLSYMKEKTEVTKVLYFSDGAASQYKNKSNFINLAHHEEDFGVPGEWHFFATSHGKGPCDGVGGTVKRLAARASLQRPSDKQILSPMALFEFATENIQGIQFEFINAEEIIKEGQMLEKRLSKAVTIVGTVKHHTFIPVTGSKAKLTIRRYSSASEGTVVKVSK